MGIYSNICELRGRAAEGKGCTLVDGLKFCAKRSTAFGGTVSDDCSTIDADDLTDTGVILPTVFSTPDPLFNSARFPTITFINGAYGTNFNVRRNSRENDGTAKKYFVSPTGNNGAAGTQAAPFADLSYALTRPDVDVIEIIGLTADTTAYGSRGWNNTRNSRDVTVINNTGFRYVSVGSALTATIVWVVTMMRTNVYSAMIPQSSARRVCDMTQKIMFKDRRTGNDVAAVPRYFRNYTEVASLDLCEATAASYWYDTALGVLHVHPFDNRNLAQAGERGIIPSGDAVSSNFRGPNVTGRRYYLRGVDFVGGGSAGVADITGQGTTFVLDAENCTFQQAATGNNFASVGAETNLYRCGAAFPARDNYNYHDYLVGGSTSATWYELECGSVGSGAGPDQPSDNESTGHETSYGITQNCYFMGGDDNCVSDIGNSSRWMLGTSVGASSRSGTPLSVGNDARMFLDGGYYEPNARGLATVSGNGRYFTRNVGQNLVVPTTPIA